MYEMCHIKLVAEALQLNQSSIDMAGHHEALVRACALSV